MADAGECGPPGLDPPPVGRPLPPLDYVDGSLGLGHEVAAALRELEAHLSGAQRQASVLAAAAHLRRRSEEGTSPAAPLGPRGAGCPMDPPPLPQALCPLAAPAPARDVPPEVPEGSPQEFVACKAELGSAHSFDSEASLTAEVLPLWRASQLSCDARPRRVLDSTKTGLGSAVLSKRVLGGDRIFQEMVVASSPIRHIIMHPSSLKRMMWDALSLVVVSYDVLTLPLLAFGFDRLQVANTLRYMTTIFWTFDILVTFITGYHRQGVVNCKPLDIAKRYILSSFVLDVTIVAIDWVMFSADISKTGSSNAVDIARLGKLFRIMRLLRILRLVRAIKFVDLSTKFGDLLMTMTVQWRSVFQLLGILRLMLLVVIANHFIACSWYALGESQPLEESWLSQLDPVESSMLYRYAVSFHWTMSQFTPAPNNFHPKNAEERYFAIGVLLFGFTMVSSFLGSIASLLTHIRNSAVKRTEEDMRVREFLSQNSVSLQLGNRIIMFLRHQRAATKKRVLEEDASGFQDLPTSLRKELRFEVYCDTLEAHPLMSEIAARDFSFMCEACDSLMSQRYLPKGHELFHIGSVCNDAFVVLDGELRYTWYIGCEELSRANTVLINLKEWICESVLWMKWLHQGQSTATSPCTVVQLSSAKFGALVRRHPVAFELSSAYAKVYASRFNRCSQVDARNDMWCTPDIAEDLMKEASDSLSCDGQDSGMMTAISSGNVLPRSATMGHITPLWGQMTGVLRRLRANGDEVTPMSS